MIKGWEYYEVRFENEDFEHVKIPTSGPRIRTLDDMLQLQDKPPLVVWSEQGLGDAIQFSRYLPFWMQQSIPFLFLTRPSLLSLFRDWFGLGDRVQEIGSTDPLNDDRPHVALMSLPRFLVPNFILFLEFVLIFNQSEPSQRFKVVSPPGGISVGVVWASNPDNKAMYRNKSMSLISF